MWLIARCEGPSAKCAYPGCGGGGGGTSRGLGPFVGLVGWLPSTDTGLATPWSLLVGGAATKRRQAPQRNSRTHYAVKTSMYDCPSHTRMTARLHAHATARCSRDP